MALKINFNYSAAVTQTAVETNNRLMSKSLLRLSTGLRILNAADDSAGLFIADQLAIVAAGLEQGNRNISTAISALQIAENSAGQIYNKLKQIYVKAENAANDINDPNARAALQREIDQLVDAIRKIGTDTEYNGIKLLDGTFTQKKIHYGARKDQVIDISIDSVLPKDLGAYMARGQGAQLLYATTQTTNFDVALYSATGGPDFILENSEYVDIDGVRVLAWSGADTLVDAAKLADAINSTNALRLKGIEAVARNDNLATETFNGFASLWSAATAADDLTQLTLEFYVGGVEVTSSPKFTVDLTPSGTPDLVSLVNQINTEASNEGVSLRASIKDDKLYLETGNGETIAVKVSVGGSFGSDGVVVHLGQLFEGATSTLFSTNGKIAVYTDVGEVDIAGVESYQVDYSGVSASGRGFNFDVTSGDPATAYNLNSIDVTTNEGAEQALLIIKKAIQRVDKIRGEIGATMNNLQAIYDAQKVAWDNTKEAENVIRNTDFTKEMMTFTTMQIRMQSGIAMLAQANTLPQLVLQLLR